MEGMFSDPIYGGNRDKAGWKMIGFPGAIAVHRENVEKYRDKKFHRRSDQHRGHELRGGRHGHQIERSRCRHRRPRLDRRHPGEGIGRSRHESGRARARRACARTDNDFAVPISATNCATSCATTSCRTPRATRSPSATIRRRKRCRCAGSARSCPAKVVGGSGVHWSGHTWRWTDMEFKVRSIYEERYGKNFIPADMTIQDWGITYAELEPYYDKFEYTAAVSGKAGNMRGQIQPGGNPFEAPRARDYPLPPLTHDPRRRDVRRRPRRTRLSSVPAAVRQRVARLHQSGRRASSARANIAATASASAARPMRRAARTSR